MTKTYLFDAQTLSENGEALVGAFCTIPASYECLNLKKCELYAKSSYYLNKSFNSMPPSIIEVDLSLNSLSLKKKDEIKEMLSGLPEPVKKVNLSFNGFSNFLEDELVDIISSMTFVREVILIETKFTSEKYNTLAERLQQLTSKNIVTSSQQPSLFRNPVRQNEEVNKVNAANTI